MADTPLNKVRSARRSRRMVSPDAEGWERRPDRMRRPGQPAGGPVLLGGADRFDQLLVVLLVVLGVGRLDGGREGVAVDIGGDLHAFLAQLLDAGLLDIVDVVA